MGIRVDGTVAGWKEEIALRISGDTNVRKSTGLDFKTLPINLCESQ